MLTIYCVSQVEITFRSVVIARNALASSRICFCRTLSSCAWHTLQYLWFGERTGLILQAEQVSFRRRSLGASLIGRPALKNYNHAWEWCSVFGISEL